MWRSTLQGTLLHVDQLQVDHLQGGKEAMHTSQHRGKQVSALVCGVFFFWRQGGRREHIRLGARSAQSSGRSFATISSSLLSASRGGSPLPRMCARVSGTEPSRSPSDATGQRWHATRTRAHPTTHTIISAVLVVAAECSVLPTRSHTLGGRHRCSKASAVVPG